MATNTQTEGREPQSEYPPETEADQQGIHEYIDWWVKVDAGQAGLESTLHLPKPGSTFDSPEKFCERKYTSLESYEVMVYPPDGEGNQFHHVCKDCLKLAAGVR
jgi:hypothetical protein